MNATAAPGANGTAAPAIAASINPAPAAPSAMRVPPQTTCAAWPLENSSAPAGPDGTAG
jgi:hypothetical protein